MKKNKYKLAIFLGILVVILVAFLDVKSATSGVFGDINNYTNGNYTNGWWNLFKTIVIILFSIIPITYYFLVHKDFSESIAIFISSYVMWMFGLADLFYFWLQFKMVPNVLPWLTNHPIIGKVATLTNGEVTSTTIYISVILGLIIIVMFSKFMEKIN